MPDAFDIDRVFKALADASRRQLLDHLSNQGGQSLGELCSTLSMTRQAVAKHLRLLEEAGLVVPLWKGREKLHYLNPAPIHEMAQRWISKYQRRRIHLLAELKSKLESENDE